MRLHLPAEVFLHIFSERHILIIPERSIRTGLAQTSGHDLTVFIYLRLLHHDPLVTKIRIVKEFTTSPPFKITINLRDLMELRRSEPIAFDPQALAHFFIKIDGTDQV